MKKYLSLLFTILLVFSLVACGNADDKDKKDDKDVTVSDSADNKNTDKDVYTLGDFAIEYKYAKIASDDEGYPSVIITVGFTNNSDSSASCGYYLYTKAEQNGEFMNFSILNANEYYSKTAEPGETIDVTFGFILNAVDYAGNRNYTDVITLSIGNSSADATCSITIDPTTLTNTVMTDSNS